MRQDRVAAQDSRPFAYRMPAVAGAFTHRQIPRRIEHHMVSKRAIQWMCEMRVWVCWDFCDKLSIYIRVPASHFCDLGSVIGSCASGHKVAY